MPDDTARAPADLREEMGPFDVIGDVHGCADELHALLAELGYADGSHAEGRRVVFLGDLVDRGPDVVGVLRTAMEMVASGSALCLLGNHEAKLRRWLDGRNVKRAHGLDVSIAQLEAADGSFRDAVAAFIDARGYHHILDAGELVVAHGGLREDLHGQSSGRMRSFCLYGHTTGETDEFGLPVRGNWARDYGGAAAVVYGHTPVKTARWMNGTICIDTGCVFGGSLTALRWPERELRSVAARAMYCAPIRPLGV